MLEHGGGADQETLTQVMGGHAHYSVTMLRTLTSIHGRQTSLLLVK